MVVIFAIFEVVANNQKAQPKAKDNFEFPFPLLADAAKSVIQAFGVWGPKKFMSKEYYGINRTTFVIDENGIFDEVITDVKIKDYGLNILILKRTFLCSS